MLLFFLSLSRILSGRRVFGNVLIMIVNNRSRRFPRLDSPRSVESYFLGVFFFGISVDAINVMM